MGLTINYDPKPKPPAFQAPAPLPKAPAAQKAYSAVGVACGDKLLKKLYKTGLVPFANEKAFMICTKGGLMVHAAAWPAGLWDVFKQLIFSTINPAPAPPQLETFLTGVMNQGYLLYEGFLGKQSAALDTEFDKGFGPPATSQTAPAAPAAKALNVEFATGKEPVVKLRSATKMYQLVGGSEDTSRYVVVAMTDDLNFAARHAGTMLSLRVEGPGLAKHKAALAAAGFSKFNTDYASVHLATMGDKTLAAKALGAVLSGLQLNLKTPWPDVKQCEKGK